MTKEIWFKILVTTQTPAQLWGFYIRTSGLNLWVSIPVEVERPSHGGCISDILYPVYQIFTILFITEARYSYDVVTKIIYGWGHHSTRIVLKGQNIRKVKNHLEFIIIRICITSLPVGKLVSENQIHFTHQWYREHMPSLGSDRRLRLSKLWWAQWLKMRFLLQLKNTLHLRVPPLKWYSHLCWPMSACPRTPRHS